MSTARVARQIGWVRYVDQVTIDADLVGNNAAEYVLGHQAVFAGIRAWGNGDSEAVPRLLDCQLVTVGLKHGGDIHHPFGVIHFFSPIGDAIPDHSPKILTTMEMAAFFAPATTIGIAFGPPKMRWNTSSPS
jgi:hypothetical protein